MSPRHRASSLDGRPSTSARRETVTPILSLLWSANPETLKNYFFDSHDRVLGRLGDSKFNNGLGWNLDLLLRLWVETHASLPFLLNELAEARQNEFAVFFDRFVGEGTQCIEEYTGGSFVGRVASASATEVRPW